jgi:hypothetical protein
MHQLKMDIVEKQMRMGNNEDMVRESNFRFFFIFAIYKSILSLDSSTYRGRSSRGGRSRFQQQNGGDSQNNNQQQNDNYISQQRQRGGSGYRGRYRANNRGGHRGNDRNYQQQQHDQLPQDSNVEISSPSDTTQRLPDVPYTNQRDGSKQQQWDVGNWNGETLIYSRTSKEDEQTSNADNNNASDTSHAPPGGNECYLLRKTKFQFYFIF